MGIPSALLGRKPGFDEPNSFYRAFRTWTGTTPGRVRHARKESR